MKFNLYQSFHTEREVVEKLDALLSALQRMEVRAMAFYDDMETYNEAVNVKTNEMAASLATIQAEITSLLARINLGMTQEQLDHLKLDAEQTLAKIGALADGAAAIAADPLNQIP